jgi:hypothetical protein
MQKHIRIHSQSYDTIYMALHVLTKLVRMVIIPGAHRNKTKGFMLYVS